MEQEHQDSLIVLCAKSGKQSRIEHDRVGLKASKSVWEDIGKDVKKYDDEEFFFISCLWWSLESATAGGDVDEDKRGEVDR